MNPKPVKTVGMIIIDMRQNKNAQLKARNKTTALERSLTVFLLETVIQS